MRDQGRRTSRYGSITTMVSILATTGSTERTVSRGGPGYSASLRSITFTPVQM